MSHGIDIVGQGMDRAEVLDKVLCNLYDFMDTDHLIVNPDLDEDEQLYVEDTIEQARAFYEQG